MEELEKDVVSNLVLTVEDKSKSQKCIKFKEPLGFIHVSKIGLYVMSDSGSPITILSGVTFYDKGFNNFLTESDVNYKAFGEQDIDILG